MEYEETSSSDDLDMTVLLTNIQKSLRDNLRPFLSKVKKNHSEYQSLKNLIMQLPEYIKMQDENKQLKIKILELEEENKRHFSTYHNNVSLSLEIEEKDPNNIENNVKDIYKELNTSFNPWEAKKKNTKVSQTPPSSYLSHQNIPSDIDDSDEESSEKESSEKESSEKESGDEESSEKESSEKESCDEESGDEESSEKESSEKESCDEESGEKESGDEESGDEESSDEESSEKESSEKESGKEEESNEESSKDDEEIK